MSSPLVSRLRSAYAWVLFTVILLPLVPVAAVLARFGARGPVGGDRLRRVVARWISAYARWSPLYDFEIRGREHLASGPTVIVANHESGLDVLCLFVLGSPARFLSADWVARVPVVGFLFRAGEHIAMDGTRAESRDAAMATVHEALGAGTPVAIFPEGRIPAPGEGLADFRLGAFRAALAAKVSVTPVVLAGTGKAWAKGAWVVEGRHTIRIQVLPPIVPRPDEDPEALAVRTRAAMAAALTAPGMGCSDR